MVNQGTARSKTNLKKRLLISSKAIYIDMTTRNIKSYKVIYLQKIFTESYLTSTNILKRIAALLWSQTNVLKFLFIGISRFFFLFSYSARPFTNTTNDVNLNLFKASSRFARASCKSGQVDLPWKAVEETLIYTVVLFRAYRRLKLKYFC